MSSKEIKILLILAFAQFSNIVDFMIVMPLGPQLMELFKITPTQFSLMVSAYTISAGISAIVSSFFIDDYDRKKTFILTYIGLLVGTLLCALSPTFSVLLVARIFTGFFGGILGAQAFSIVGDIIQVSHRGRGMAMIMASFSLASIAGVPLSLYMANEFSWHAPFIGIVLVGIPILVMALKILPTMTAHLNKISKRSKTEIYGYILKSPQLILALSLLPVLMFAHFIIIPFISPSLVMNAGFTNEQLPLVYMVGGAFTILSTPIVGKSVDSYGAYNVFRILAVLTLIPMFALINLQQVPMWHALAVTTGFFVLGSARSIACITAVTGAIEPRFRGGFMSINTALQQLACGISAFLAGVIVEKSADGKLLHYDKLWPIIVLATLASLWIFKRIKYKKTSELPDSAHVH